MSEKWESHCNLGNVKLYEIFQRKYGRMWEEWMREQFGPSIRHEIIMNEKWQAIYSQEGMLVDRWRAYLKDMGLDISDKQSKECCMDPCSKMGQSRYWPQYINVPEELAMKILVLGELP